MLYLTSTAQHRPQLKSIVCSYFIYLYSQEKTCLVERSNTDSYNSDIIRHDIQKKMVILADNQP